MDQERTWGTSYDDLEGSEIDELHGARAWWVVPVFCLGVLLSSAMWPYDLLAGLFVVLGVKAIQYIPQIVVCIWEQ